FSSACLSASGAIGADVILKLMWLQTCASAAGDRWEKQHVVALGKRRRPARKLVVDGDLAARDGVREAVTLGELGVELRGRGRGRAHLLAVAARALAENGEITCVDL